ncbi:MAG: hypothetical protein EPN93_15765 [Spirochaetes bacterium]|nr:MAG: hypothetical protein EPN93_15765 [Spirochaetota bacterium]
MNKSTKINVATLGVLFGFSGISHGFFEMLQGYAPTGGLFIAAIGEAHRMWPHGSEPAFSLVRNYLVTGIAAMTIGSGVIIWSFWFVHKKNGPTVFLILFIMLLLFGGGIAQVVFFPFFWIVATRINKPLASWRKIVSVRIRKPLGKLWPWSLIISSSLMVFVLVIAITGFIPAVKDPDTVLSIMLYCLAVEIVVMPMAFLSGFARDSAMRPNTKPVEK